MHLEQDLVAGLRPVVARRRGGHVADDARVARHPARPRLRAAPRPVVGRLLRRAARQVPPGSLWSVLVQADIAAHLKVPRRRTAVTGLLALGLSLLTGLLVGLPATSFLLRRDSDAFSWWVLLAVPLVVVLCWPRLLNAIITLMLRTLRREPLEHDLSGRAVLTVGRHLRARLARLRGAHPAAGAGRRRRRPAPRPHAGRRCPATRCPSRSAC